MNRLSVILHKPAGLEKIIGHAKYLDKQ